MGVKADLRNHPAFHLQDDMQYIMWDIQYFVLPEFAQLWDNVGVSSMFKLG